MGYDTLRVYSFNHNHRSNLFESYLSIDTKGIDQLIYKLKNLKQCGRVDYVLGI